MRGPSAWQAFATALAFLTTLPVSEPAQVDAARQGDSLAGFLVELPLHLGPAGGEQALFNGATHFGKGLDPLRLPLDQPYQEDALGSHRERPTRSSTAR